MNPLGGKPPWYHVPLLPLCLALLVMGNRDTRAEEDPRTPSNLQVFQSVAGRLADSLAASEVPSESLSVVLTINPQDVGWFLKEFAERAFRERGWSVGSPTAARYEAELSMYDMKVAYGNPRRSGIFGPKLVDRKVTLRAHVRLFEPRAGRIYADGDRTAESSDVVEMSLIESLENPSVPQTHGKFPSEDFFAGWAEPLVLLAAVAVAVYLLFTVRS